MRTYSHSGAVPVLGALGTILASAAAALVGGFAYAYAFYYIPIVQLNVLLTLAFGAGLGLAVGATAHAGKVRSPMFVGVLAVMTAFLGLYAYWASYLMALAGMQQIGPWAFWPPTLLEFGAFLFQNGSWGMHEGENVKGNMLVLFWIAEGVVIVGLASLVARRDASRPFCEACNEWTQLQRGIARLAATGSEPGWNEVLAGDLPALASFEAAEPGSSQFVRLDVARCPRCENTRFLTVNAVEMVVDKNGQPKEKERLLIANAILTPAQFAVVEACGTLYRQQLDAIVDHRAPAGDVADDEDADSPAAEEGD